MREKRNFREVLRNEGRRYGRRTGKVEQLWGEAGEKQMSGIESSRRSQKRVFLTLVSLTPK